MAIDEAVWLGRRAGATRPTIRFFAWAPPTVSLGYGQPLDAHVDVAACRRLGVGLVRRLTGGSAIYHDGPERELTYSVVAAADDIGGGGRGPPCPHHRSRPRAAPPPPRPRPPPAPLPPPPPR